jgi:hypothetical protein
MATSRQGNWLGQQRIDLPDLRSIESATSRDFDILAGTIMGGKYPLIVKGFTIPVTNKLTNLADTLLLNVADSILVHYNASESGTIFATPATATTELLSSTNSKVLGSFTPSATNYIGLDYLRSADTTTSDLTKFLDAGTLTEIEQTVPKARTLDYRIIITTQAFTTATNIAPLAIVVTDANNAVVSIKDTRNLFFRLGSGGDTANESYCYPWATDRTENGMTYVAGNLYDPFAGGDKSIGSMKDWMNAAMTGIWECRGGEFWYSAQNRDQVKMVYGPRTIVANEDNFYYNAGVLEWMNISLLFENGNGVYRNDVSDGSAAMIDGQCLYVDLDRSQDIIATAGAIPPYTDGIAANVTDIDLLGTSVIPGRRYIIAWMINGKVHCRDKAYPIDRPWHQAGEVGLGVVRINKTPVTNVLYANDSTDSSPVVLAIDDEGQVVNAAFAGNSTAFTGTGFGAGGGGYFSGGSNAGPGATFVGGGTTGFGSLIYGPNNTAAGSAGAYTVTDHAHTAGPAVGAVVWGGSGQNGGDGIEVFARGDGTVVRHGVIAAGSNPHLLNGINCNGGDGVRAFGGPSTSGVGAVLSSGGYCYLGLGAVTTTGGTGISTTGGAGPAGGDAVVATGGEGLSADGGRAAYFTGGQAAHVGGTAIQCRGGVGGTGNGTGGKFDGGDAAVGSTLDGGVGLTAEGGTGDAPGLDGVGITGASGTNIGIWGVSGSNIGIKGQSVTDAGGEFGGSNAIRITSGEIVYVPPKVRYATIAAADFVNDGYDPGLYTFGTGSWINEPDGTAWALNFSAHIPVGSVITGVHLLVASTDTAGVSVSVHLNHSLNSLAPDEVILTGLAGSGVIVVGAGAVKAWVNLGAIGANTILEGSWLHGHITVDALTDITKFLSIYGVRLTYTQSKNANTI